MQSKGSSAGILSALVLITLGVGPALAAPNEVLILQSTVANPPSSSREYYWVQQLGFTPVVVNGAQWASMTTGQFSSYEAIVLGDPSCAGDTTPILAAIQNQAVWNAAVDGNVILIGTDAAYHSTAGGDSLIKYGLDFVTANAGSGETGAFVMLSCYYGIFSTPTQVTMLDSLSPYGTFSVYGSQCHNLVHKVVSHPSLTAVTDSILSYWYCSTHEVFDTWPSNFVVLAIGRNFGTYVATDGATGQPYILARGTGLTSTTCVNAPADVVNWWPLGEASGPTAADIRGTADNGTHVGGPTPTAGKVQGALQFDGLDDQVDIADATEVNFASGDFTIDAWIRTSAAAGTAALVDKIDAGTTTGYALILQNGILGLELADGTSTTYLSGSFVADNNWHLAAVSVDRTLANGIKFYVDGVPAATGNPTLHPGSLTTASTLVFGARSASGANRYAGLLDEVEMFDRALTHAEVMSLVLADTLGKCPTDAIVGACCLPDKSCILALGQTECDALGGFYLGDSTTCDSGACDQFARGACCLPDGSCADSITQDTCINVLGGLFQGIGTSCDRVVCAPLGACCLPTGTGTPGDQGGCVLTMGQVPCDLMGGIYLGDLSTCDSAACDTCACLATGDIDGNGSPLTDIDLEILIGIVYGWVPPLDSMCHADLNGDYAVDQEDIDLLECYLANGPSCFTPYGGYPVATCCHPNTITGACCTIDTCYQYVHSNCLEGSYQGDSTKCLPPPSPCPQDTLVWPDVDTVIIVVVWWPPIDVDTLTYDTVVVIGPFDPGPIGVAFVLHDTTTRGWGARWQDLEQPGALLSPGTFLQFKAYQKAPGALERAVGTGKVTRELTGEWELEVDFSPLGPVTQSVQLFRDNLIVATLQQHTGPAGAASSPPSGWHWSTRGSGKAPSSIGCTGVWAAPTEVHLGHGKDALHVLADSVRFIPEMQSPPTGFLTKVILSGAKVPSVLFNGWTVDLEPCCVVRGDFNGDGAVKVSDLTGLINYLFRGGAAPGCPDHGDTNADGSIKVSDLTLLVNYLFRGGPAPAAC